MYRTIMVPLDGSRFAECALATALSVSRRTGAEVRLATVEEPLPTFAYGVDDTVMREWTGKYLNDTATRVRDRAGAGLSSGVLTGHVVDALESEADRCGADLVVMATHGRGVVTRAWLGSVTDAFVRRTDRPVLLVRAAGPDTPEPDCEPVYDRILIPLDGSDVSESVLSHALAFGDLFGASYTLLRVVSYALDATSPYLPTTFQMEGSLEEARSAAEAYLEGHAARIRARGVSVDARVVVDAQPGHGILGEVAARECRLVAMATHGRGGVSRAVLGSTTDKVLRGAHVPLLLYRYHAES